MDHTVGIYPDNEFTRRMRRQVEAFNEMLGALNITFTFDYAGLSDRAKPRVPYWVD
jgi:hypothetical protein